MIDFPEPRGPQADPAELFPRYLDFFRETVLAKVGALSEEQQRSSVLPSGWTPLEMLSHLVHMERRWFVWGFLGEDVPDPFGDTGEDDRWRVPAEVAFEDLADRMRAGGRRTTEVLAAHPQDQVAPPGPRFDGEPASLGRICFHVLQEYARHAGHLDASVELATGATGE